jgi:hypothetical protein
VKHITKTDSGTHIVELNQEEYVLLQGLMDTITKSSIYEAMFKDFIGVDITVALKRLGVYIKCALAMIETLDKEGELKNGSH